MTHYGVGFVLFPTSWRLGVVRRTDTKLVFAVGPFRLTFHGVK